MVLDFAKIVPCLQSRIAEKIDYFDLLEMEISSRQGKVAVDYINIMPIVKTNRIWFGSKSGYIHLNRPGSRREVEKEFTSLNETKYLPRFFISKVKVKSRATSESITHAVINDNGRFIDKGVHLDWHYEGPEGRTIMEKMIELFDITKISMNSSCITDRSFMSMPIFNKICMFSAISSHAIPDDILLSLKAPSIYIGTPTSFPHIGPTVRAFLKQYFQNQRQIEVFDMMLPENPTVSCEDWFTGLEYFKLLWSLETHESSDFAHIPRENLPEDLEDIQYYLVHEGEKKLIVLKANFMFNVQPTSDENAHVLSFLDSA